MTSKPTTQKGKSGEKQAIDYLLNNGYNLVCTNYRFGRREIDIIVEKSQIIIFVEVKLRKNKSFGNPEDFVSDAQIQRIHEAAEEYIYNQKWLGKIRFDVIAIIDGKEIFHIQDAF
ncbi:MAG: YraN family protein [Cytophagales bacterium]|nr:MAG: YraN family protein [Cytophagales bacterium]